MTQTPQFHSFTTQPIEAQAQQQPSQQLAAAPAPSVPPEPDPAALPATPANTCFETPDHPIPTNRNGTLDRPFRLQSHDPRRACGWQYRLDV